MTSQTVLRPGLPPYGVAVRQALVDGSVATMKASRDAAEHWLAEHGDLRAAVEVLKAEIAKHENAPS